jgi:hypothetical protein
MKAATASKWTESCTPGFCRANEDDSRKVAQCLLIADYGEVPVTHERASMTFTPANEFEVFIRLDVDEAETRRCQQAANPELLDVPCRFPWVATNSTRPALSW